MEPTDNLAILARRTYERARARRALLAATPVVIIAIVGGKLAHDVVLASVVGAVMFAAAAIFFWRGLGWARGVLPGVAAGVLPFAAMHAAQLYGHACAGSACFSVCVPAAAVSGTVAGALIGRFASHGTNVRASWLSASLFAALTGSLACACVGAGGLVGLAAGLVVGSVPLVARPLWPRA
jgi:hypothetical protein